MGNKIDWRLFRVLLVATFIAGFTVLPYLFALNPAIAKVFTPAVIAAQIVQYLVLFSIAIYFGLRLGKRVGLGLPIVEGMLAGEKKTDQFKSILGISIGGGVLAGVLIVFLSIPFGALSVSLLKLESTIAAWKLLLVPFYGGIVEEILLRFFVMTLLVWISWKTQRTSESGPTAIGVWIAIIVSSVIFGLGHLPVTGGLTAITPMIVVRSILLNGVAGIIFGWLYWKRGLESAMIAHFSADVVLHVLLPISAMLTAFAAAR